MDVTPLISSDRKVIQSYKGGIFKISNEKYDTAIFVLPDRVIPWQLPVTEEDVIRNLHVDDFRALKEFAGEIDVLLLGTGPKQILLHPTLRVALKKEYGFSIEAMDTGAACRTYNVLMAEGRQIAAALI
jgi:uncharacterized protein